MSARLTRTAIGAVAGLAAAAVGLGLTTTPAAAAGRARLVATGLGTYASTADGLAYQGQVTGDPFSGDFTGVMAPADGTLPAVGECEAAHATLRVDDGNGRFYALLASGEVCGIYLPLGMMQRFTGRWTVTETSLRRLSRVTGITDIRLLNGQSDVYATAT